MSTKSPQPPRLRSACDACHQAKVRCTGGSTCLHCRNHDLQCHYSYAARIGKPKGSRNRKTFARLQSRTISSVDSGQNLSSGLSVSADGALWDSSLVAPAWNASYPQDSYSCSWLWQPLPPSPPESVNSNNTTCFNAPVPEVTSSPADSQGFISANAGTVDAYTPGPTPWVPTSLPPDSSIAEDSNSSSSSSSRCDCLEQQTSQVIRLHQMQRRRRDGEQQEDPFDNSGLQDIITSCLQACQKTLRCLICEKDESVVLLIVASIQMALRRLEEEEGLDRTGTGTPDESPLRTNYYRSSEEERYYSLKQTLLRQALSQAQDTIRDLQSVIAITPSLNSNNPPHYKPIVIDDSSYLQLMVNRLQMGVDMQQQQYSAVDVDVDGWVGQVIPTRLV